MVWIYEILYSCTIAIYNFILISLTSIEQIAHIVDAHYINKYPMQQKKMGIKFSLELGDTECTYYFWMNASCGMFCNKNWV